MPLSALRASTKPRTTSSIVPPAREWNWEPRRSARVGSRPGDRTRSRGLGHWPALPGTPVPQSRPPSGPASAAHSAADSAAAPQPPLPPTERNAVSPGSVRKQPQDWVSAHVGAVAPAGRGSPSGPGPCLPTWDAELARPPHRCQASARPRVGGPRGAARAEPSVFRCQFQLHSHVSPGSVPTGPTARARWLQQPQNGATEAQRG